MKCLNCGEIAENKYCSHCGQSTSVHRFSLKHFFSHDVMHGALHLDHSFPETIVKLFSQFGNGVRGFVQGKRIKYFNYITLLFILIGFSHFLEQYAQISLADMINSSRFQSPDGDYNQQVEDLNNQMFNVMQEYPKATILSLIPFYALISLGVFRKAKQNYAEHLVLTCYKMAGVVLIGYPVVLLRLITTDISLLMNVYWVALILGYIYTFWFIFTYFRPFYEKKGVVIRKAIFYSFYEVLFQLIIGALIGAIYLFIVNAK